MIQLTTTSEKLQILPGTAGDLDIAADAVDISGTTVTVPTIAPVNLTTTTTTDIVPVPAASTARRIKYLGVRNTHTTVTTTIIIQKVASVTVELIKVTLLPGWELIYNGGTWFVYDANGAVITGPTAGRYLRTTVKTSGTTFITGVDTDTIVVEMVGGGGGGGGCTSVGSAASGAGGGGGGAYAKKVFDVLPNTSYACVVGAAGAGVSGAAGANGTASTFTVGATTVTAPGGTGAPVATTGTGLKAYVGGTGATIATNGDLNLAGQPGHYGVTLIVTGAIVASGSGADSALGAGGLGLIVVGNGNPATGFGGGGGGAATGASAVRTGGSGSAGVIMIEEYT